MRRGLCALLALACLPLAGCGSLPRAREMGDMVLLRTIGVDQRGEDLEVTASTGPRAQGIQGEDQDALTLAARAPSLSGAMLALQRVSERYVFFGYVDQLLLGEELARRGVEAVLDHVARDTELSLGAQLWLVRDGAARGAVESGGGEGVETRLSTFRSDGELGLSAIPRTAGEVFSDLLEWGSAYVPALSLEEEEGGASLRQKGYGVLKDGGLAGFLGGEAAAGLELLAGRVSAHVLEVETAAGQFSVLVTGSGIRCGLTGGGTGLSLSCRVTARLTGWHGSLTRGELAELAARVEAAEEERIGAALAALQAWGTDCTGLTARAARSSPWQSPLPFEELSPEWSVEAELRN